MESVYKRLMCNHCYHSAHCGYSCIDDACDHCTECACDRCRSEEELNNIDRGYN
jgi:hypothetical protein